MQWTARRAFGESSESDWEQWRWCGAGQGRGSEAPARLTCRASPLPTQVSALGPTNLHSWRPTGVSLGSHRLGGRQLVTQRQGGRRACTHSCPRLARLARPPGQVEQKPGQGASAGAAVERVSHWPGQPAAAPVQVLGTASLDQGGSGRGSRPAPLLSARWPQRCPCPLGLRPPIDKGQRLDLTPQLEAPSPAPMGRWPPNQAVSHTDPRAAGARLLGRRPRCRVGGLPGDRGLGSPWDPHFGIPGLGMQGFVMGFGRAWGPVATGWEGQGPSPAGHILRISCLFPAPDKRACNETTVIPVISPSSREIPKAQILSVTIPAAVLETHSVKGCPSAPTFTE